MITFYKSILRESPKSLAIIIRRKRKKDKALLMQNGKEGGQLTLKNGIQR